MFKNENIKVLLGLISLLVVSRLVPHWPNFTALGAVAILAPRWFRNQKLILLVPVIAMILSDLLIGFHQTMGFTYLAVLLVSFMSLKTADQKFSVGGDLILSSVTASMVFFLITNLGAWYTLPMYPKTLSGLILSYWNGLPFLGYEFLGTGFYMSVAIALKMANAKLCHPLEKNAHF